MAGKLPRGFTLPASKDTKTGASGSRARPTDKREGKKPAEAQDPKKRSAETLTASLPKKLKLGGASAVETTLAKTGDKGAPSQVTNFFGPISAPFISEHILQKWQSLSAEDQEQSMIRASAQLMVQTIERAQRNQEGKAAFAKLQAENKRLNELVVEEARWKKDLDASRAEARRLKEELKGVSERYTALSAVVDKLKVEKEEVHAKIDSLEEEKLDWEMEKDSLHKSSFMSGFNCYLINFLAQDPDYDWSKFGPGCLEDIAAFKVDHADEVAAKRVELGLEGASEEIPPITQPSSSMLPPPPPTDSFEKPPLPTDGVDKPSSPLDVPQVDAPILP